MNSLQRRRRDDLTGRPAANLAPRRPRCLRGLVHALPPVLLWAACSPGGDDPLGWGEPVEAREVRQWSRESLDAAPRWNVAETPTLVIVPDSVESVEYGSSGEIIMRTEHQRYTAGAAFLPDGRVVLRYATSPSDSILLHLLDPATGRETRVRAPTGADGQRLRWSEFGMDRHGRGIVLVGNNRPWEEEPRSGADVWFADETGAFVHPRSHVTTSGVLVGALGDGSLVFAGDSEESDSLFIKRILAVRPVRADAEPSPHHRAETLFTTAVRRDSDGRPGSQPIFTTTAVAENTIWIVPTERPELWAVRPSGDVELKVEWEAGDRSAPPRTPGPLEQEESPPAAAFVRIGLDGLIYVQLWTVLDGRSVPGPEWLVFTPKGELAARLQVPVEWSWVYAFGEESLVAVGTNEATGLREVRVYGIRRGE